MHRICMTGSVGNVRVSEKVYQSQRADEKDRSFANSIKFAPKGFQCHLLVLVDVAYNVHGFLKVQVAAKVFKPLVIVYLFHRIGFEVLQL